MLTFLVTEILQLFSNGHGRGNQDAVSIECWGRTGGDRIFVVEVWQKWIEDFSRVVLNIENSSYRWNGLCSPRSNIHRLLSMCERLNECQTFTTFVPCRILFACTRTFAILFFISCIPLHDRRTENDTLTFYRPLLYMYRRWALIYTEWHLNIFSVSSIGTMILTRKLQILLTMFIFRWLCRWQTITNFFYSLGTLNA